VYKSSLQLLLDENSLQVSKQKVGAQTNSTTQSGKGSFFSHFWKKLNIETRPALDIDWLDFAHKSSFDEEILSSDAYYIYNVLDDIINRMQTTEATSNKACNTDRTAIIDFSNASLGDLQFLMQLFTGCSMEEAQQLTYEYMLQSLSAYIPFANVQTPKSPQSSTKVCFSCGSKFFSRFCFCQNCGEAFCSHCILKQRIYQLNLPTLQHVCEPCCNSIDRQNAELWKEKCLDLISTNDLQSVMAAHGCMAMALCSGIDPNKLLYTVAKRLTQQKFYKSSLEFFTMSLFSCTDTESVKTCVAIGSTLQSIANCPNTEYMDQLPLLMAANSAYTYAQKTKCPIEIPSLDKTADDITRKLHNTYDAEKEVYAKRAALKLETAWASRNCYNMISVLLESDEEGFGSLFDDYAMIGLEKFLLTKVKFINTMHGEDSAAILFFQGILKLHKNEHNAGLLDIEKAVWKGYHSEWMPKAAIDILISVISDPCNNATPHENLQSILKMLSIDDLFSNQSKCLKSLSLNLADLTTPITRYWPELVITGVNSKATYKYEQAAMKLFNEGKWTAKDVALAYIDFIPSHEHPAEICVCFLLAGLWFLKELETIVSVKLKKENFNPKVYATKRAVFLCTGLAFCASQEHFHLGMQLYASRLGLQIILHAKGCAQSYFTRHDSYFLSQLLAVVIRTSQFFPFWNIPIVMACDAPILHILTGKLHSEFILALQHIPNLPFKDHELKYQLYENHLRYLCPLDNPDEAQLQAMNSMLTERGWSVEDVSFLMTSPLSPRTSEGWLIQEPKFGVSMEYASIEGFVLDLQNPSLQLLVVKADKRNIGLVSQNDISECLQLPDNSPIFFSLDPPDEDQRFHPFQAFRYEPKELQSTTLLHTMFETDYLLKSFSVGSEVSSVPPFKQRPCREGLVAKLPQHLQDAVRSIFERGQSMSHMQRFWIQADELEYDERDENGKLTIKFKKPKMTVCTHSQMIDTDGKLKDSSENVNPNSPEFKFALDMTTHYDEIGTYFPMFARLQEIVKIWFLCMVIKSVLQDFKNKAHGEGIEVPRQVLTKIQQEERKERLEKINKMLSQIQRQYQSNVKSWYQQSLNVRSQIVSNLLKSCHGYGSHGTMESKVDSWLNNEYSAEENLIDYICGCIESNMNIAGYLSLAQQQQIREEVSSAITSLKSQYQTLVSDYGCQVSQAKPQIAKELTDICKGNQRTIEDLVNKWLDSYSMPPTELVNYMCDCLPQISSSDIKKMIQADCQKKHSLLSNLVSRLSGAKPKPSPSFCNWVPAALHHTVNNNSYCLCYGGVLINPVTTKSQVLVNRKSVYVPMSQRQPNDFKKYYRNPPPRHAAVPKQKSSICTSARNNSNGAMCFPFNTILNNSPKSNIPSTQLQLEDKFTNILQWSSSQRTVIRHPNMPQINTKMQNSIRAHVNAQRTILSSRNRFSQMKSEQMHGRAGDSRNQRNSGRQKNRYSSATRAAAGLGVGAALASASGGGDGSGSDDDGGDVKSKKYIPWKSGLWSNSEEGSYMKVPVSSHIQLRGVNYFQVMLDGKMTWISMNPAGYKFNGWAAERQTGDSMKLKNQFQFNANGTKEIHVHKQSELLAT